MANLRILWFDVATVANGCTMTADPAMETTLPVTNLQKPTERGRVARTTGLSSQDVKLTWAANQTANCLVVSRNNLTASGTIQPRQYSDAAWSSATATPTASAAFVTSGLDARENIRDRDFRHLKNSFVYFTQRTDIRSFIARIADGLNPDGHMEATKLMLGKADELTLNPGVGEVELTQMDGGVASRADDGSHIVDKGWKARRLVLPLSYVADADLPMLYAAGRYLGLDKECAIDLYPSETGAEGIYNRMVCRLESAPGIGPVQYGINRNSFIFVET